MQDKNIRIMKLIILILIGVIIYLSKDFIIIDSSIKVSITDIAQIITSLVTLVALIYTIKEDRKNKKKELEKIELSNDQQEFKKMLINELYIYDKFEEVLWQNKFESNKNFLYSLNSLSSIENILSEYKIKITNMISRIKLFYRIEFKESDIIYIYILELININELLIKYICDYNDLLIRAYTFNRNYLNSGRTINDQMNEESNAIIQKRSIIINSICSTIDSKREYLYYLSNKVIEERQRNISN